MDTDALSRAATEARGLAIDAVHKCSSGHLGLPLGAAEMGAVLFGEVLDFNPDDPQWLNRDRFVLSAGHGSMFLYAWLHLAGYEVTLDDIKAFRSLHSNTPGHPEFEETPGVEATTGPLGQGVGNATGMAVAQKMLAAQYNTPEHKIFDHHVFCLAGDGCMQEGVAQEASAFAGHFKLDNLILIFDSNDVTLDAMASATQSADFAKKYEALGWDVTEVDGHDMDAFRKALEDAKANDNGKPKYIIAKTLIGKGIPEVAGTSKGHGEGGAKFAEEARRNLGLPSESFYVSDETRAYFTERKKKLAAKYEAWRATFRAWKEAHPEEAKALEGAILREVPEGLLDKIPEFDPEETLATRKAGAAVLQPLADNMPTIVSGSADLHGSTLNYIKSSTDFGPDSLTGRNIRFGIREHAMGAIVNGMGYYGVFRPSGATFLTFSDYMRGSIRLSAIAKLPIFHIFTHDSVGVGEDGPTHQPVETTSALRLIPNLHVIRPADPEETAGAFYAAIERVDGPTALVLTRQGLPNLREIPVKERREGALKGGYIAKREKGALKLILIGTGSELQHCLAAAKELGDGVRVVSMPCCERFDEQDEAYRESVLPASCRARVAMEAGVPDYWGKYVGLDGRVVGISTFGLSAPAGEVMKEVGITADHLVEVAREVM